MTGSETVLLFKILFLFSQTPLKYCLLVAVSVETLVISVFLANYFFYLGSYTIREVVRTETPGKALRHWNRFH